MNHLLQDHRVSITIKYWALWLVHRFPGQELEDASQDMWIEAIRALKSFDSTSHVQFPTFLYSHLRFKCKTALDRRWKEQNSVDKAYRNPDEEIEPPASRSEDSFLKEVCKGLKPREQRILSTLMDPPEQLHRMIKSGNPDSRYRTVRNEHLAICCGVTSMQITRSLKVIEKRFKKVMAKE